MLLWLAAVGVIYGVSYSSLQGLQAPLASLVSMLQAPMMAYLVWSLATALPLDTV